MNMSLYELTGNRLALQRKLEALDIDAECIADTLEGESEELQAKITDYGYVIRGMVSFGEMMKAEADRMAARYKAHEAKTKRIREWLLQNMLACNISKIECAAFTISVRNNPPAVVVDADSQIPADYFRQPETPPPVLDKKLVAQAIKDGFEIPGVHLEIGHSLVIK